MDQLPVFLNLAGRPVVLLGDGEAAAAKRRLWERAGARIVEEGHAEARIAVVAIEDEEGAVAAVERLKAAGLLVNAVDRPALCDFTTPAIVDRDPVLVAIGTGGASAGLAKALRQRLEALMPARLGKLAEALFEGRDAIRARWPDATERRRAIDAALTAGGVLDPFDDGAADRLELWLTGDERCVAGGTYRIALASDDPDDLTLRQLRLLGGADRVLAARDVPQAVLVRARADASVERTDRPDAGEAEPGEVLVILTRT